MGLRVAEGDGRASVMEIGIAEKSGRCCLVKGGSDRRPALHAGRRRGRRAMNGGLRASAIARRHHLCAIVGWRVDGRVQGSGRWRHAEKTISLGPQILCKCVISCGGVSERFSELTPSVRLKSHFVIGIIFA